MNRSWVRFPQAAQIRPPGTGWAFLYVCAVSRCCLWLVAPRVLRAPRGGRAALCARGRRPAREPSALRASLGASPRSPARPRHRPRAPQPGPPVPPAPSTPVVPGRCCLARRVVSRPALALPPPIYFARNSPEAFSNIEFTSLELQRFREVLNNDRDKLRAKFI